MVYSSSITNAPATIHLLVNILVVPVPRIVRRLFVFMPEKNISLKKFNVNNFLVRLSNLKWFFPIMMNIIFFYNVFLIIVLAVLGSED